MDTFLSNCISFQPCLGLMTKKTKITRKLCSNPPKGDGQTSSPNQVRPSKISEMIMGDDIIPHGISLHIVISSENWL